MNEFKLRRLGMLMEPEPGNPLEVEGVLNPAAVRGPDGELYLFPRMVAKGNYSRIGIARVRFNETGDPASVERLGIALEPEPGNPLEVEGVLNPAAVRGPDGELYLFPRMIAKGNYSRIGIATGNRLASLSSTLPNSMPCQ